MLLLDKVCLVKAMVFSVVIYVRVELSRKVNERWIIDAFELWCWRRLWRVPQTARRVNTKGNQPWIFIGRTDAEAETPILWPPDVKNWIIEKTLMLTKIEGRRRGWQRTKWLDGITHLMDISFSKLWALLMGREAWHVAVHGVPKSRTWLSNWTELSW